MEFNFDVINAVILITTIANAIYGLVIYSRNRRDATNIAFFMLTLGVFMWGGSMLAYRGWFPGLDLTLGAQLLYASASIIPIASLYFARTFPNSAVAMRGWEKFVIPLPFFGILAISLIPGLLIENTYPNQAGESVIVFDQFLHILYVCYIVGYFSWVFAILGGKFLHSQGVARTQFLYVLLGTFITASVGVVTNLLLPFLGIFSYNWVGQVGVIAMITAITYAILKHHLFNVKIIATEIFVFLLWIFILIQTILSESLNERIANGALFLATVCIGLLLLRSVIREVRTREHIEKLAKDLEKANARLKELDRQKTEFVSIASHQLRSPLTAIKGYSSLLMEGSYGKLSAGVLDAAKKIFDSSKYMALSIEDFLNVSRIELGTIKYEKKNFDLKEMVKSTVEELSPAAHDKGLRLEFTAPEGALTAMGDIGKLKQVISNLVDNAMKYTQKGRIDVSMRKVDGKVRVEIKDTGMGISRETQPKLFEKFVRAKNANNINVSGTGLGLFVAKQFVTAHGGKIWVESEGEGKGSTFIVELPIS